MKDCLRICIILHIRKKNTWRGWQKHKCQEVILSLPWQFCAQITLLNFTCVSLEVINEIFLLKDMPNELFHMAWYSQLRQAIHHHPHPPHPLYTLNLNSHQSSSSFQPMKCWLSKGELFISKECNERGLHLGGCGTALVEHMLLRYRASYMMHGQESIAPQDWNCD